MLSRAYLKLWELIIYFDLIEDTEQFTSAHIAEGPGSFIQATIMYRELQEKLKKIKSCKKDKYYVVTMYSDNEHLQIQKDFINNYSKESPKRLHVLETISTTSLNKFEQEGGGGSGKGDGDITKLNTIKLFGGSGKTKGFAENADLFTADGGFDWKNEKRNCAINLFSRSTDAVKRRKSSI